METKICSVCNKLKTIDEYNIFHNTKKLRSYCKVCEKEKRGDRDLKYRINNRKEIRERVKKYRLNNKEKIKESEKTYRLNNKEKIKKKNREWKRKTSKEPYYIAKRSVTKAIQKSIKRGGYTKKTKTFNILGCIYKEFKKYIESQWRPWMSWDNYGNPKDGIFEPNKTWELDHIIPLASAINENDIIKLNYYTNFQPLCSYDNRFIKKDNQV